MQQLECSRLKLMQLELEIEKAKKQVNRCGFFFNSASISPHLWCLSTDKNVFLQGFHIGGSLDTNYIGASGTMNPGL